MLPLHAQSLASAVRLSRGAEFHACAFGCVAAQLAFLARSAEAGPERVAVERCAQLRGGP